MTQGVSEEEVNMADLDQQKDEEEEAEMETGKEDQYNKEFPTDSFFATGDNMAFSGLSAIVSSAIH